jgi:hypothetical protein
MNSKRNIGWKLRFKFFICAKLLIGINLHQKRLQHHPKLLCGIMLECYDNYKVNYQLKVGQCQHPESHNWTSDIHQP